MQKLEISSLKNQISTMAKRTGVAGLPQKGRQDVQKILAEDRKRLALASSAAQAASTPQQQQRHEIPGTPEVAPFQASGYGRRES